MMTIKSLRLKFTLWYIGSVSFLFLLLSAITILYFQNILINNIDTALLKGTVFLGESLSEYKMKYKRDPKSLYEIDSDGIELLVHEFEEEVQEFFLTNVTFAQLLYCQDGFDISSEVIVKTKNLKDKTLPFPQENCGRFIETPKVIKTVENLFEFPIRLASIKAYDFDKNVYILQAAVSFHTVSQTIKQVIIFACMFLPFVLSIFTIFGFLFMKKVFSPIRETINLTNRISADDLSQRLMVVSNDEIGELSKTINLMIERLERSFLQIKQFSEDAAHELKTPISKLKCNAEISLRKVRSIAEYQNVINSMIEDVKGLEEITDNLLLLSRMDSQKNLHSFKKFLLHELMMSVFEEAHPSAYEKELIFDFDQIDDVEIYADKGLIRTMLINLTSNAVKYTPGGGNITLSLRKKSKSAALTITDSGVGIPEDALPFIFDRFFRVDPSRTLETGGTGLGLCLVHKIVEFHGGEINVKSSPGKGSTFFVTLPRVI